MAHKALFIKALPGTGISVNPQNKEKCLERRNMRLAKQLSAERDDWGDDKETKRIENNSSHRSHSKSCSSYPSEESYQNQTVDFENVSSESSEYKNSKRHNSSHHHVAGASRIIKNVKGDKYRHSGVQRSFSVPEEKCRNNGTKSRCRNERNSSTTNEKSDKSVGSGSQKIGPNWNVSKENKNFESSYSENSESNYNEDEIELSDRFDHQRFVSELPTSKKSLVDNKFENFQVEFRTTERNRHFEEQDSLISQNDACDSTFYDCKNTSDRILTSGIDENDFSANAALYSSSMPVSAATDYNFKESCKPSKEKFDDNCALDDDHMKTVTDYIQLQIKEYSVKSTVNKIERDLNRFFKEFVEGSTVDLYGSYFFNAYTSLSDINLLIKTKANHKKGFLSDIHKSMLKEIQDYEVMPYEDATKIYDCKISLYEPYGGIMCNLKYLEKKEQPVMKMNRILNDLCSYDGKVKALILACKIWASVCNLNEVEEGKLNSYGFTLMVIHFLQQYKAVLPIINTSYDYLELKLVSTSHVSVGELWLGFLKYFSLFNWDTNVVSITSKSLVSKLSKGLMNDWFVIEDPYTGKNVASAIENMDSANYIKACFHSAFKHFSKCVASKNGVHENDSNDENGFCYSFRSSIDDHDVSNMCSSDFNKTPDFREIADVPYTINLDEKLSPKILKDVKTVLFQVNEKYALTDFEVRERKAFVVKLERIIRRRYKEARLHIFGSSANGFGFKNSDLDICLTFQGKSYQETEKDVRNVLGCIRGILKRDGNYTDVFVISQAEVPIVKFFYKPNKWRGDISLYNTLAVRNTRLLYTYSTIDERCAIMGRAFKLLAKKAFINESSTKCLSSYSFILMVIHFLQQIEPPVLPVLQHPELRKRATVEDLVDGWNTFFCEDSKIWDIYKEKNETPLEVLWLNLFDFYCQYNKQKIITIRQKEPLDNSDTLPSAWLFNIQDPFIENKNLGKKVDQTKALETEKVLRQARYLFRHESNKEKLIEFYFSSSNLTGRFVEEKECKMCGKFDHVEKDCQLNSYFKFRSPCTNQRRC